MPPRAVLLALGGGLLWALSLSAAAAGGPYPDEVKLPPVHPSSVAYRLEPVAEGLPLPVSATPLGDGSGRLLLVSLEGRVWLLSGAELSAAPYLDLSARVTGRLGEQGLFSVALEPATAAADRPRRLVAAFTERTTGDLLVAAYPLRPDAAGADHTQESVILRVPMPEPFHHGGQVAFGPDGLLYVSVGSGEISTELLHVRPAPAQDLTRLLGKLLRLDLAAAPYRVPADNPFTAPNDPAAAAAGARPEIWASGFRNPWKFTFGPDGALYLADVGMDRWEEVDLVARGADYGWPAREGAECLRFPDAPGYVDPDCALLELADPLITYAHLKLDPLGGQSVTGGVVVADPRLPELVGRYVYGDFVTGRLWAFDPGTARVELLTDTGMPLTEVTAGEGGELLLLGIDGRLMRLMHAR